MIDKVVSEVKKRLKRIQMTTKTVNDLINKYALLEKELSSAEIDKNYLLKNLKNTRVNEIIKIAKFYISFEKNKKKFKQF